MPVLAAFDCLATPSYKTLIVRDADADAMDDDAMARARREVAASSGYQMYLWSKQDSTRVRVAVEVWDGPPTDGDGPWEGSADLLLACRSGLLLVAELAQGVPGQWTLPAAGDYRVRVRWRNRQQTRDRVTELERRIYAEDADLDRLAAGLAELEGLEEYRLDMWLERRSR
jgi:hypothetical protein